METISVTMNSRIQIKHAFARLKKSAFIKNVLIIMSGTAMAQGIGFALTPIISRLFSPSDFGIFGSFDAVVSVVAAGVTLDYAQAIMLPKHKEEAINLFIISFLFTTIISTCCLVICSLFPSFIQGIIKAPNVWMIWLLSVAILISGVNQSCQAWCVRVKAFKQTSASQVIRSLSSNGSQIGFGFLKVGAAGLIASRVLADVLASLYLVRILKPDFLAFRHSIKWNRIKQLAKDYRDFPMYSASQNVIDALSRGLPVLLLAHFYGIVVAGAYTFGVRILQAPMGLVLSALRQVLFQKASETYSDGGRLMPLYLKITTGLFALALLPALVLFIWAPPLFTWIFGTQWHTAGEFARWLTLWLTFLFCNLPSVLFARIIRIQRTMFIFNQGVLSARFLALFIGGIYLSPLYTIMLFSVVGAIVNIICIFIVGFALKKREGDIVWRDVSNSTI